MVATGYDGANRVNAIAGNRAGQQTAYVAGASYAAHGAPSYIGYGNQVARSFTYTNRLSLSSYWDAFQNSPSNYLFAVQENWGTTNNNGNLLGETIWKGGPAPLSSMPQVARSYSYDTVNGLTAASDSSGWSRQFGYDAENRQVSATEQPSLGGGQELYLYDGAGQRVEKVSPRDRRNTTATTAIGCARRNRGRMGW